MLGVGVMNEVDNNAKDVPAIASVQNSLSQISNNKKKIIKNFFFNALYQIFLIIIPLITTPYISRVLSPEGVGQYSFSSSLITYFTICAVLGANLYGQREISKYQGNKHAQSIVLWEVFIVRVVSSVLCLIINLIFCGLNLYGAYNNLMFILSLNIFAVIFDFSYVMMGNEAFGKLALRNFLVKILNVICIFIFVKSSNDVWIYTLIQALSVFVSGLVTIPYLYKHMEKVQFRELNTLKRVPQILKLFLPTIIISIYSILDKTLVGMILKDDRLNGYYDQTDKIIKLVLALVTALSSVMISRNSEEKQKGNVVVLKENVYFASKIVYFLALPFMFGIMAISKNMNLWFFGEGYAEVSMLMITLAPIILAIGLNNVTGVQYLISVGRETTFTVTVLIGAIVNLTLSIGLVFAFGVAGAMISSVVAEIVILIVQLVILRKEISLKKFLLGGWKNLVASLTMFGVLWLVQENLSSSLLNTALLILLGGGIYFIVILILQDDLMKILVKKIVKRKINSEN